MGHKTICSVAAREGAQIGMCIDVTHHYGGTAQARHICPVDRQCLRVGRIFDQQHGHLLVGQWRVPILPHGESAGDRPPVADRERDTRVGLRKHITAEARVRLIDANHLRFGDNVPYGVHSGAISEVEAQD